MNSTKGENIVKSATELTKNNIVKFVKFAISTKFVTSAAPYPNTNLHYIGLLLINKTKDKKSVESATELLKNC